MHCFYINEPNNAKLYTHNLERLIVYADALNALIDIPEYVRARSLEITDWEVASRYDYSFSVRIDILKKTYHELAAWYSRIKQSGASR